MIKRIMISLSLILLFAFAGQGHAEPDYYYGDSSVYTGTTTSARPNIMFLIDNSGAMKDMGSVEPYDPAVVYVGDYPREQVYLRNVANENNTNYQETKFEVDEIECSKMEDVEGTYDEGVFEGVGDATYQGDFPDGDGYDDESGLIHPRFALEQNGFWYGALDSKGTCPNNENQWENYFTGNYRNYLESIPEPTVWEASTPYAEGDLVTRPDEQSGLTLKCVVAGTSDSAVNFDWPTVSGTLVTDGTVQWEALGTVMEMVQYQMEHVVFELVREKANMGLMTFGDNNHGGAIIEPILKAGPDDTDGDANYQKLIDGLAQLEDLVNGNTQPVNESLWDASLYWIGNSDSSSTISSDKVPYPSPIEHWCQSNHLVILTTGSAGNNSQTKTKVGDIDGDGEEGLIDDVAKKMYDDLGYEVDGVAAKVNTHAIQLMTPYVQRLELATDDDHGHGIYRRINNPAELIDALVEIIAGILEADSSFVAPVVPASPENRAYSGKRIYLGFFKPMNEEPWYGNLKKFGLNYYSQITALDASDNEVLATDADGYFLADDQGNPTVHSYWSTEMDGGLVASGGVGALLKTRGSARNIYTYNGTSTDLTDSSNSFSVADDGTTEISATSLGFDDDVADADEAKKLIKFVHGIDSFGDITNDTTAQRPWFMGDIMHSKPVVLNYANYVFNPTNEEDTTLNQAYIFVGANDGMLHAFKDASGEESWAFIPPDLLPNLSYLRDPDHHYYFVDNSPTIYVYDADEDGTITPLDNSHPDYDPDDDSDNGDRAILIFGMRRGGGTSTIPADSISPPPSLGSYYALDITDPEDPQYMWQINSEVSGFGEMGQTWSLPRLTKMRIGSEIKVVAVFGAGYDTNEDLRYGNTQNFPDNTDAFTVTSAASQGEESTTSLGSSSPYSPRGRGIYIVEVATLVNGIPNYTDSGSKIWSFTNADDSDMTYSIPSDPLVVDRDRDGFIDHIYVGDTGGQLWRFNVENTDTASWEGTRIFTANTGNSDVGRKVFYKPTATVSDYDTFIYFGTGDREHPLNTAVTDRFYVVRDRQISAAELAGMTTEEQELYHLWNYSNPLTEANLVDVTTDQLQEDSFDPDSSSSDSAYLARLTAPNYYDGSNAYYGWYLKLVDIETNGNGDDVQVNYGEKVLAVPKVVAGNLYFSTYTPVTPSDASDPCVGELGPSRLYVVSADKAEAVYNFYTGNDTSEGGDLVPVLQREDRHTTVGDGIASEPLILVNAKGELSVVVGRGGGFFNTGSVETIDPIFPVYWMKW